MVVVIVVVAAVAVSMRKAGAPISVSVSISPTTKNGDNGTTITYTVTVNNTGTKSDSYTLAVTDNAVWSPSLSTTSLTSISAGSSGTSTLSVTIPSYAAGGTIDSITVTATSQENTAISASSSCTARVSSTYGATISISPSSKSDLKGVNLTYLVTVNNTGNASDTYSLTATNTLGWTISVSPSSLIVPGGSNKSATLNVAIPTNAVDNSIDSITVTATGTGVSDSGNCTTTVLPKPSTTVKSSNTLVYDSIGEPESLDPAWAYDTSSGEVILNVNEPLIFFKDGNTDEFEPRLADNWTISSDGLTYTFHIRTGVKFHNGDNLTPQDVEYSFERAMVQDRDGGPVWMFLEPFIGIGTMGTRDPDNGDIVVPFAQIDSAVTVVGDSVVFHLKQAYGPFLQILAQQWSAIVDKNWCIAQGDWPGTAETYEDFNNPQTPPLQEKMNGTGPFKLDRWEHGVQIVLMRNDNYWRTPATLESIVIKEVDEWTDRKLALLAGDADYAYVPRANLPEIENITGIRVTRNLPQLTCDAIFFNFNIGENSQWIGSGKLDGNGIPTDFFSDKNVRLGFAYSFDWDTFIHDAFLGQGTQPASPIIEGLPYIDPSAKKYSLDLAKAETYFKQAFGGALWENGFELTVLYNTGNVPRRIGAEILKQNIESLNPKFSVVIEARDWPTYLREMVAGNLTMYYLGWQADFADPHNFVSAFMSSGGALSMFQSYNNPLVDNLINSGIVEPDPAKRQAIYYQLQQLYYDDVPSLPTIQTLGVHVERDWVNGWYNNPIIPGTPWGGDYYQVWKGYY